MIGDHVIDIKWDSARLASLMAKAPDIVTDELATAIEDGSALVSREVKERTPTSGAGTLRDSIGVLPVVIGSQGVSGGIGTSLAYALPIELGSKPHWAPIEPLAEWVQRRLGKSGDEALDIAKRIRFKIAKKGTPAHHMFRDGATAITAQFHAMLERALDRAVTRMGAAR